MRICKDHWSTMRKAIDDRGLSKFIAATGEELVERVTNEIQDVMDGNETSISNWDPLMSMNMAFINRVLERRGLSVMAQRENEQTDGMPPNDGHVCPLCLVRSDFDKHNPTTTGRCDIPECTIQLEPGEKPWDDVWIDGCSDAQFEYAKEHGLIQVN